MVVLGIVQCSGYNHGFSPPSNLLDLVINATALSPVLIVCNMHYTCKDM